jgi:hypothetical protein
MSDFMRNNTIVGTTRRIGKSQGYKGLCIRDEITDLGPSMTTSWQPSPEDIDKIVAGHPIYVTILGTGHPPIMITVGPEVTA